MSSDRIAVVRPAGRFSSCAAAALVLFLLSAPAAPAQPLLTQAAATEPTLTYSAELGVSAFTLNRPFRSRYGFDIEQPWRSYHGTLTGVYGSGAFVFEPLRTGVVLTVGSFQGGTVYGAAFLVRIMPSESPIQVHARLGTVVRPVLRTAYDPNIVDVYVSSARWAPTGGVALTLGQRFLRPRIGADVEYSHGSWGVRSSAGLVLVF